MIKKLPLKQSGQALLIILLVMLVGMTISLSLLFRTTTDIKLSRQLEESSRALSAAEAGVEETLRIGIAAPAATIAPGASYQVQMQEAGVGSGVFSLGRLEKENVGTVWLANYEDNFSPAYTAGKITLCWDKADSEVPKIEAIILYKEGEDYKVTRDFYEASLDPETSEDCDDPDNSLYPYKKDINLPSLGVLLALRLRPIGGAALVAVDPPEGVGGNSLPSQGKEVVSTGRSGDTVRKVRVVKSFPSWPEIFDYVLFSGGSLTK